VTIKKEKVELPPTILAGKVLDAETGRILQQVKPSLAGGKTGKADLAAGETFAFTVDAGRDYSLKAEQEGYEPLTHEINHATIIPNKKNTLTLTMKPTKVWGIFGHVFEKGSNDPLKNVEVIVTETATGSKVEMTTDGKGDFRMELKPNSDYEVMLKKRKYFTVRGSFSSRGRMPGWFDVNKFMRTEFQKVVIGAIVEFGNIYYDSGSWYIRPDVTPELDKIVQFLNDNPTIVVELGAHTDSMGDAGQNMILSQKRAKSAVEYLVNKGIKTSRISDKGYGETKIKNRCTDGVPCSPEEHQANRRTEIRVLDITR
jgi:outer membrane protein OmpA-like peptidoglycan-associated protein